MVQIKMFRATSRQTFETTVNKFLKENEIDDVIDIKMNIQLGEGKSSDYIGTIIYRK